MPLIVAKLIGWFLGGGWRYVAGAIVLGAIIGAFSYTHHRGYLAGVIAQQAVTATVQNEYDSYRAMIEARIKAANDKQKLEEAQLRLKIAELEAQFQAEQQKERAKEKELNDILAKAKPGDLRALGPIAREYYQRLRQGAPADSTGRP